MGTHLKFAYQNDKRLLFYDKVINLSSRKIDEYSQKIPFQKGSDYHQNRIAIPTMEGHEIFFVSKIIRCEANGNYTKITYTENESPTVVSRQLKCVENTLQKSGFIRIHHSHLINPFFIKKILKSEGGQVEMVDGTKIRISRNKEEMMELLFGSIEKI